MKNEIIVAVVTAILVSLGTWFVTTSKDELSKVQLQSIADNIVYNDSFMSLLLVEFKKDSDFHGSDGLDGKNGIDGKPGISDPNSDGTDWCSNFAETMQICWGHTKLKGTKHTRGFGFTFSQPFASPPTITNGINAASSGFSYAIYSHKITAERYTGSMVETRDFRSSNTVVTLNYVAIGKRK